MRLKDLEITLQSIERFTEHDVMLESYPTPANIAASIVFSAEMEHNDIIDRTVLDLGCGDGIFALAAALFGAKRVIGIDVQTKALKVSRKNSTLLGIENTTDWVLGDVSYLSLKEPIDTVVSNPPFGVKNRGADLRFLRKAISIAKTVYSIHLAGEKNRIFLEKAITDLGGKVTQIETFDFPIDRLFEFHKKARHMIRVDLYRVCVKERKNNG